MPDHAEILAPAGNEASLKAAFAAGADAVYLALDRFGARAYAKNFTLETLKPLLDKAHLAGRKIYVTMNTLLHEDEMEDAFANAKALYDMGVDALIVQDLGLIHMLHERLPELELHASTQISVQTPEQIRQLEALGIQRVVLARECSLDQIRACADTGMEIEAFVHGALCISWSGQCEFSAVRYNRSGNRGACAQPCRMEYTLLENGKPIKTSGRFLLSPKDLSLLPKISDLEENGVNSLKIEGRMKSPAYVYQSVKKAAKSQSGKTLNAADRKNLEAVFNRQYTLGHTFGLKGDALMNADTSNHAGIHLGQVLGVKDGKIRILLDEDLHQDDGIRFLDARSPWGMMASFIYDENGKLTSGAKKGDIVYLDRKHPVDKGSEVRKTVDILLEKEAQAAAEQTIWQQPATLKLSAKAIGEPIMLTITAGKHSISIKGDALQSALKTPTDHQTIVEQLSRTGNSFISAESIEIDLPDNIFIPVSALNKLRRKGIEKLEKEILKFRPKKPKPYQVHLEPVPEPQSYVEIRRPEQMAVPDLCYFSQWPIEGARSKGLMHQSGKDMATHLNGGTIIDPASVTNSYAIAALLLLGYKEIVLSDELSDEQREQMLSAFKGRYGFNAPAIMKVYQKPRLMIMNHCPVNTHLKDGQRKNCSLCHQNRYELEGLDGKKAILEGNPACQMELFDEVPIDRIDDIPKLKAQGVPAFAMILTDEDQESARRLEDAFEKEINS